MIHPPVFGGLPVTGYFTTKGFSPPQNNIYLPVQKHTDRVVVFRGDPEPEIADAVITGMEGICLGIRVADCVPILLYDGVKKIVGAVHAGWRGTAGGILTKTIKVMADTFGSSSSDILIAVGPSIKACCYEVGREVVEAVCAATGRGPFLQERDGKPCLDLSAANRIQAESAGVPARNIWVSEECTFCLPEKFHSYRYSKETAGRQYGIIGIV